MKILVDADACPVKEIIINVANILKLNVLFFMDTSHIYSPNNDFCEVITVDKGFDSADIVIINRLLAGDVVVTQDFGVAALALAKKAYVINQNGFIYTQENIDKLMFERYLSQKVRRNGGKTSKHKKRTEENNVNFEVAFKNLCLKGLDSIQ